MPERRVYRRFMMLSALTGLTCVFLVELGAGFGRQQSPVLTNMAADDVVITLERKACLGFCPVYTVRIDGTGLVTYNGKQHVKIIGEQVAQLDPSVVQALVEEFYRAGYFALEDRYESNITDNPTTVTSLTVRGQHKSIIDYVSGPPELKALEKRIDEVAHTNQWIGAEDERLKMR